MKILSKRKEEAKGAHAQLPKINRVCGQLDGVKRMIEGGRPYADVLTQLRSVRGAIRAIECNLLNTCLKENACKALGGEREKEKALNEVCVLFTRFEN